MSAQVPPEYPRGGDPRRRWTLRERLYLHRRNARAFDQRAGTDSIESVSQSGADDDTGDWWADTGMTLGVEGRQAAGAVHPWRMAA